MSMPRQEYSTETLLTEIRDLLSMLVEANLPAYQTAVITRLGAGGKKLRESIRSDRHRDALWLMDGQTSQVTIANRARMDQGDISRLVSRLVKDGFVSRKNQGPLSKLAQSEIDALRAVDD